MTKNKLNSSEFNDESHTNDPSMPDTLSLTLNIIGNEQINDINQINVILNKVI